MLIGTAPYVLTHSITHSLTQLRSGHKNKLLCFVVRRSKPTGRAHVCTCFQQGYARYAARASFLQSLRDCICTCFAQII